jgi:AAA15 family ATPase/GTPase
MHEILEDKNCDDAHTFHIYCKGNYNYITQKMDNLEIMKNELEMLRKIIKKGISSHPVNKRLQQVSEVIEKAYMLTAVMGKYEFPSLVTDFE